MVAYIFPGQGSQFEGMGKDLYSTSSKAKDLFDKANLLLGYNISEVMFEGTAEDLKQTKITQPAIFIHSIASLISKGSSEPYAVAGHSLGELSALVAAEVLSFEDGLKLVAKRALFMQKACEQTPSTMAAILGLENSIIEKICQDINGVVVCANYNCPGQIVISGENNAVNEACNILKEKGAKRAMILPVSGAFHSPLMETAKQEFNKVVEKVTFKKAKCPIYQNVTANKVIDSNILKENLITQLVSPVKWTQSIEKMIEDGISSFIEVGPGKVLQGLVKKINKFVATTSIIDIQND